MVDYFGFNCFGCFVGFVETYFGEPILSHKEGKVKLMVSQQSGIRVRLAREKFLCVEMDEQNSFGMIKLTPSNYSIWKRKMRH